MTDFFVTNTHEAFVGRVVLDIEFAGLDLQVEYQEENRDVYKVTIPDCDYDLPSLCHYTMYNAAWKSLDNVIKEEQQKAYLRYMENHWDEPEKEW